MFEHGDVERGQVAAIGKALGDRLFPKPQQADLRRKMAERWAKNDKHAYLASFNAIVGWGVQERLSKVTCPTLIISADRSDACRRELQALGAPLLNKPVKPGKLRAVLSQLLQDS